MVVHGLAATIRSVEESETFDLAGQNGTTISSTIVDAFTEPFVRSDISRMVRITLIIGAGKQARQKYDDNALKYITVALQQQCGYVEDRAASCIPECAGSYKSQHDTAKNLKTIVIFPKMVQQQIDQHGSSNNASTVPPLIPIDSPKYKIATSSVLIFNNMLKSKCPSWIQKKGCLQCIEEIKAIVEKLDTKLISGNGLNDSEQAFYDVVTVLDAKEKLVRDEMQKHIENNTITPYEKQIVLQQNAEKITELQSENKPIVKAQQRKEILEKIIPQLSSYPLKFDNEIRKLQKELIPLLKFYEQNKGKLVSIQDTYKLTRKEEIENEITNLEEASRGWFEDEIEFQNKIQASRDVLLAATKAASNKKTTAASPRSYAAAISTGKSNTTGGGTKWVLPGETGGYGKIASSKSSKKNKTKGSLFSAMMMDDSDDDEDDDSYNGPKSNNNNNNTIINKSTKKPTPSSSKDGFTEVVSQKPKSTKQQPANTKGTTSKQTVFGKANIDSDSDDDDDYDNDNEDTGKNGTESGLQQESGEATSKSKKKKNKKKKNTTTKVTDIDENTTGKSSTDALNEAYQKAKKREREIIEEKKKEHENEHIVLSFLRIVLTLIIEIIMAITTWIIATVVGKPKQHTTSTNKKRK